MPLSVMGQFEGRYDGTKGEYSLTSTAQSVRRTFLTPIILKDSINSDFLLFKGNTQEVSKKYQPVHHMVAIYYV